MSEQQLSADPEEVVKMYRQRLDQATYEATIARAMAARLQERVNELEAQQAREGDTDA